MNDGRLLRFETSLRGLQRKDRLRSLIARQGVDFTSNDYLGLADAPRIKAAVVAALERGIPVGAGGSRLLRGNHPEHEALEAEAAAVFGTERALFLGSGYAANVALLSTLPQKGDLVVYDELIHASAREGMTAGRAAAAPASHNDAGAVEGVIRKWRTAGGTGAPWIVVESLYSMDGDRAPLADLFDIVERHEGFLVIDEAHATGVHGADGRGLAASFEGRSNVITLHTCGKALGVSGALIAASATLIDYLVNRARPFIYATAPSPLIAAAVREALRVLVDEPERRERLASLVAYATEAFGQRFRQAASGSQILPLIVGDNSGAARVANRLRAAGFDLRAIRPPTVPEGTARVRIAITVAVDEGTISAMLDELATAVRDEAT